MGAICWPRLKALYLEAVDQHWLKKIPTFENLQILQLRDVMSSQLNTVKNVTRSISHCRHLRVIDVEFHKVDDPETCLIMAHGCPLLRRFCVRILNPSPEMTGDQFSRLLQALPHVELLSLSIWFQMAASNLRDLVNSCPRLTMLQMSNTRLHLSLQSLAEAPPLQGLREMHLRSVWFNNPNQYVRLNRLQSIAGEWSRVFPRIRRLPCPADVYGPEIHLEGGPSSGELDSDGDGGSTDDNREMPLDDPGLDFDEYGSDWFNMRRRLWKLLGYETGIASDVFSSINYMWQTNFEIKTFGWPVVSIQAFLDPKTYSTAEIA